jgi:hypothetical protein
MLALVMATIPVGYWCALSRRKPRCHPGRVVRDDAMLLGCEAIGSVGAAPEKAFLDKHLQHSLTLIERKVKQPRRLSQGRRETAHLLEFVFHAMQEDGS